MGRQLPPPPIPRLLWASGGPRSRGLSLVRLSSPAVPRTCGPSTGAIRPAHSRRGRAWEGARFLHTTHISREGDQPAAAPVHIPSKWSSPNQESKTERRVPKTNEHAKQARRSPRPPERPQSSSGSRSASHPFRSGWVPGGLGRQPRGWAASAGSLKDYMAVYLPLRKRRRSLLGGCQRLATRAGESPGGGGGAGAGRRRRAHAQAHPLPFPGVYWQTQESKSLGKTSRD